MCQRKQITLTTGGQNISLGSLVYFLFSSALASHLGKTIPGAEKAAVMKMMMMTVMVVVEVALVLMMTEKGPSFSSDALTGEPA